jgi:hypothetical protein
MGGSISYSDGQIGCILARKMYSKHQGATTFRLDHDSLEMTLFGQSASHSFCNSLVTDKTGEKFIGYEVGDNFPRGL